MASAKFSAFEFASEEFNSDLARLVEGFTHSLVKIISQECARKEAEDDGTGSKKPSPFSSPKGKAPRKKAAPKRGRPSKEETDVVIDEVSDLRSVSEDLSNRTEAVRSSSKSPRDEHTEPSIAIGLDDLFINQQQDVSEIVEDITPKKGKTTKKEKVVKEKKEKVVKEKKEKVVKEKKEKVVKEKKEPNAKKGKKGETVSEQEPEPVVVTNVVDEDDNDGIDTELLATQISTTGGDDEIDKLSSMMNSITIVGQLDEEHDYANVIDTLEEVVTSSQKSCDEDEIVVNLHEERQSDEEDQGGDDEEQSDDDGQSGEDDQGDDEL
jgi:hypothetical protein